MRSPTRGRLAIALAVGAVLVLLLSADYAVPAGATTVGGSRTSTLGPFVLSAGRLMLPRFSLVNLGPYFEPATAITRAVSIQSLGTGDRGWQGLSLDRSNEELPTRGLPAIAARASASAAAWIGASGLQSALLGPRAVRVQAAHPANGEVRDFDVALGAGGRRAVVWSDDIGTHLQVVSEDGVSSAPVLVSSASARTVMVTTNDNGGWWVTMLGAGGLTAIDVDATGGATPVHLASSLATPGASDRLLDRRAWTALSDGHDGLWVGLPHALLHTTASGPVRTLASGGFLALAGGDGASAVAQSSGRDVLVRTLGARLGRAIRLADAGFVIDVAFDAARRVIVLLTGERNRGVVRLREISPSGRVRRSQALAACAHRQKGQVEASEGLVAVSCAGPETEAESVHSGGDMVDGRTNAYLLLRAGRKLRANSYFEGSEDF
jgi:hypothetical protein